MSARLALGVAAALAGLAALGRSGGRNSTGVLKQRTPEYDLNGVIGDSLVGAFDSIAMNFLDQDYWLFLDIDEPVRSSQACYRGEYENAVAQASAEILDHWGKLGVTKGPIFEWNLLEIHCQNRGQGLGRAIVIHVEDQLRAQGVQAIILQAGMLNNGPHSLGFWKRMGYQEWPGDYLEYDDRIMVKKL